tara:strand:- start:1738 stop:2241 length:504 start_codon:yes stop_codon:yes gene_type:complete
MTVKFPSAEEVASDVSFTEAQLDDNMIQQPALVAHYGRLLAEAQYDADTNKQMMEIAESKAANKLREAANDEGRKITESLINSTLPTVKAVAVAREKFNRSKSDHEVMKTTFEAFRQKKDMMVQIGVNRRAEIEGKINGLIRADKQDEAAQAARREAKAMTAKLDDK